MNDTSHPSNTPVTTPERNIWMRGLMMILMVFAFQITATLLGLTAVVQFVMNLVSSSPNQRLSTFGADLGRYLGQIASFVSFNSEELPFPFSDWPSAR